MKRDLIRIDKGRIRREFGVAEERLKETQKVLNDLEKLFEPIEYERALYILWASMAANDRHSLVRALVAFYDEYVELREGASLDDIDQLIDRWFGTSGPRVGFYDELTLDKDRVAKAREHALPVFEGWVKKAAKIESVE